jgi:hypothetical protein
VVVGFASGEGFSVAEALRFVTFRVGHGGDDGVPRGGFVSFALGVSVGKSLVTAK